MVKNTLSLGPVPTPHEPGPGPDLEPSRARVLRALREAAGDGGATVGELVEVLGGHPNTVRHHVAALATDGLVEPLRPTAAAGRGRPPTRYRATATGAAALGRPEMAAEYVALAGAFADRLAGQGGDPGADALAVGRAWGSALSESGDSGRGTTGSPRRSVVGMLERLGFSPTADEAAGGDTLLLRTCPLLEAARRHPEVVCQVHRGLVEGVLVAHGAPGEVGLRPFDRPGACVLRLPTTSGRG